MSEYGNDRSSDAARAERTEPATGEDHHPQSPKDDNDYSWGWDDAWHLAHDELLAARAKVLGQVDAALRDTDAILQWRDEHKIERTLDRPSIEIAADYLRGKFIAGGAS